MQVRYQYKLRQDKLLVEVSIVVTWNAFSAGFSVSKRARTLTVFLVSSNVLMPISKRAQAPVNLQRPDIVFREDRHLVGICRLRKAHNNV